MTTRCLICLGLIENIHPCHEGERMVHWDCERKSAAEQQQSRKAGRAKMTVAEWNEFIKFPDESDNT